VQNAKVSNYTKLIRGSDKLLSNANIKFINQKIFLCLLTVLLKMQIRGSWGSSDIVRRQVYITLVVFYYHSVIPYTLRLNNNYDNIIQIIGLSYRRFIIL